MCAAFMKKIKMLLFLSNINQSRALSQANIWGCVSEHSCSVCPDYCFFARSLCLFLYLELHWEVDIARKIWAGLGSFLGCQSLAVSALKTVIPVSWGIVSHLPGGAVGINLGFLAFWMCCHPHVQDVVFQLWADRWVESRPCWAVQR